MWVLLSMLSVQAASPESLSQTVAELAPYRAARLATDAPALPADAYAKAAAGEVVSGVVPVPGHAAKKGWGVAVVEAPIDAVWGAINHDGQRAKRGGLAHFELQTGAMCGSPRQVFQYIDLSMVSDRWWVIDVRRNDALHEQTGGIVRESYWQSPDPMVPSTESAAAWAAKGTPVAYTKGAWLAVDLGGGETLVEYYSWADPGGMIPAGVASSFAAGSISKVIKAVSEIAKEGAGCQ